MNKIANQEVFSLDAIEGDLDAWSKLLRLAKLIDIDKSGNTISITNGAARITLHADGIVRVEGRKIIQSAHENIALDAAYIDLN